MWLEKSVLEDLLLIRTPSLGKFILRGLNRYNSIIVSVDNNSLTLFLFVSSSLNTNKILVNKSERKNLYCRETVRRGIYKNSCHPRRGETL